MQKRSLNSPSNYQIDWEQVFRTYTKGGEPEHRQIKKTGRARRPLTRSRKSRFLDLEIKRQTQPREEKNGTQVTGKFVCVKPYRWVGVLFRLIMHYWQSNSWFRTTWHRKRTHYGEKNFYGSKRYILTLSLKRMRTWASEFFSRWWVGLSLERLRWWWLLWRLKTRRPRSLRPFSSKSGNRACR